MASFVEATTVFGGGGSYRAELDSDWAIWGPNGGYVAAIAMRAMADHGALGRPATFSCQFLRSGDPGVVTTEVVSLRAGRRAECVGAVLRQGDRVLLNAVGWLVADQPEGIVHSQRLTPTAAPSELGRYVDNPAALEDRSRMWGHIERRPVNDNRAMFDSGVDPPDPPYWRCWHRLVEDVPGDDYGLRAARALLFADSATWPAVTFQHEWPMSHVAPTLDLSVMFHSRLFEGDGPLRWSLVEGRSREAGGGLVGGSFDIWSQAGHLEASGVTQGLCQLTST